MTIAVGSLLAGLALLVIVAVLVALPFLDRRTPVVAPASPRQALEEERRVIVRAIRDLDFDYRTGKLNEADYRALRAVQVERGAEVLRRLDACSPEPATPETGSYNGLGAGDPVDAEIEASVTTVKRERAAGGQVRAAAACPACGNVISPGDRFCAQCGRLLQN